MAQSLGLFFTFSIAFLGAALLWRSNVRPHTKKLLLYGIILRVLGGLLYLLVLDQVYGGGDYVLYYHEGQRFAADLFTVGRPLWNEPSYWWGGKWWGTQFVVFASAIVQAVIGPSLPGLFVVFSLLSYVGIVAFALAFARAFPNRPVRAYLPWIILFPSLWFWPTALGKDAIVLCGLGLATLGFAGRGARVNWFFLALGVALIFVIRPQVAVVFVFALLAGQWIGNLRELTFRRVLQGAVGVSIMIAVLHYASGALGFDLLDRQAVQVYLEMRREGTAYGGSSVDASLSPWLAPVNTLFRPFPWEISSITTLVAGAEVLALWWVVWWRRRSIAAFLRAQENSRFVWFAAFFVAVYAVALGMAAANLGLLARQRVHMLPLFFIFLAGGPKDSEIVSSESLPARNSEPAPVLLRPHRHAERWRT